MAGHEILHASDHLTGGSDAIQEATAAQVGLATAAQIAKLDGIAAGADVAAGVYLPLAGGDVTGQTTFEQVVNLTSTEDGGNGLGSARVYGGIYLAKNIHMGSSSAPDVVPNSLGFYFNGSELKINRGATGWVDVIQDLSGYLPLAGGVLTGALSVGTETLTLNANEVGAPSANVGFTVNRGTSDSRTLHWDESVDAWRIETNTGTFNTLVTSNNLSNYLQLAGGTMTGALNMGGNDLEIDGSNYRFRRVDDEVHLDVNGINVVQFEAQNNRFIKPLTIPLGTLGAVGLRFSGDQNTGFYSPGADQMNMVVGGAVALAMSASGVQIGTGGTPITSFSTTLADDDNNCPTGAAIKAYGDANWGGGGSFLPLSGGALTGSVTTSSSIVFGVDKYRLQSIDAGNNFEIYDVAGAVQILRMNDSACIVEVPQLHVQAGTNSSPSIVFEPDTDLGIFRETANTIGIAGAGVTYLTVSSSGIQMSAGTRINEFSIDGTFGSASDNAVPTELAVKTYVGTSALRVDGTNNMTSSLGVGIAPVGRLHLHDTSSGGVFSYFTNGTTGALSTDGFKMGIDATERVEMTNQEATDWRMISQSTTAITIVSGGDVVIGQGFNLANIPTSASGLSSGDVWSDAGTLKIVA